MPGPRQLQRELLIEQQEWEQFATACQVNPKKRSLSDAETARIREGRKLLDQSDVNSYQEIADYFENKSSSSSTSSTNTSSIPSSIPSSTSSQQPISSNLIQNIIEEAAKTGIATGELYSQVLQESAQRRFEETVNSGELKHNLAQGFQNILFNNGLTSQQLREEGRKMVEQISEKYEPQLLNQCSEPLKMIEPEQLGFSNDSDNNLQQPSANQDYVHENQLSLLDISPQNQPIPEQQTEDKLEGDITNDKQEDEENSDMEVVYCE